MYRSKVRMGRATLTEMDNQADRAQPRFEALRQEQNRYYRNTYKLTDHPLIAVSQGSAVKLSPAMRSTGTLT